MEYFLASLTLISSMLAIFSDTIKTKLRAGTNIVRSASFMLALGAFFGSYAVTHQHDSTKDDAKRLIEQGEQGAVRRFLAPISFFYGDYLGGRYIERLEISEVTSPAVLTAMQNLCFFERPKHVTSFPPTTWGERFRREIRGGMKELRETKSLYQAYMSPIELEAIQVMEHDSLVESMMEERDFAAAQGSPLIHDGSCGGLRPSNQFTSYLQHVSRLQELINHAAQ